MRLYRQLGAKSITMASLEGMTACAAMTLGWDRRARMEISLAYSYVGIIKEDVIVKDTCVCEWWITHTICI